MICFHLFNKKSQIKMDYGLIIMDFSEEEALSRDITSVVILNECKKTRSICADIARTQIEEVKKELCELYENYVLHTEEKKGVKEEIQRLERKIEELIITKDLNERKSKATTGVQYHNIFKYDRKKINTRGSECDDRDISSCKCTIIKNTRCNCI